MSTKIYALSLCAALFVAPCFAGTLASSTNSLPAFTGITSFSNPDGLDGDIEYAVFTTAGFATEFPASGFSPLPGDTHVYAFQVFNNGPGTDFVSAQISAPVSVAAQGAIGDFEEDPADIGTSLRGFVGASAQWLFTDLTEGFIDNGEESGILVYSSPFGPTGGYLVTINGGTTTTTSGPVPGVVIPEPASALVCGVLALVAVVRRRG